MLKSKAGNCLKVRMWLTGKLIALADADPSDKHLQNMAGMLWGYCSTFTICLSSGMFFHGPRSHTF